jgi:hypothetical protein
MMSKIIWKYVKPLEDQNSIKLFWAKNNIELPCDVLEFLKENNGGRPSLNTFDTDQSKERVFKALLSYNFEDKETIYKAYSKEFKNKELFPIASDAAGNFICINLKSNNEIVLVEHESGRIEHIGNTFSDMLSRLY